jgi:ABC-type branched-subunit amino acid transport system ATPase component
MTGEPGLDIVGLTVRFGGHVAVDDVSLSAPLARLTGLIGPNGAGKTTIFNACSGLKQPTHGQILLFGADATALAPAARAQRGLGRTFQRMELFGSMTVAENVALGREAGLARSHPWRQLVCTGGERSLLRAVTEEAMEISGITAIAGQAARALSTGQRRLVELARAIAGGYRMLLLDEPSSGLDATETIEFGRILRRLIEQKDVGILLVEHDMSLVMSVCDHLYVLDFGCLIFEGTPAETMASPAVRAAYLGSQAEDALLTPSVSGRP